ncbi:uncharacterized protein LOC135204358 isoform X1 [Macrobrachium nipponense]|uniref:uncharacterized protein LOC135204358 isoform X1 n=3 Tax=Macrobrachium nipponense TaxID=159736 RepID=UPI0030C82B50
MSSLRAWQTILVLSWMCVLALSASKEEEERKDVKEGEEDDQEYADHGVVYAAKSILTAAGSVWNDEVLQNAVTLRRAIRSVGRSTRDLSSMIGPILNTLNNFMQVFSYLPGVIQLVVNGVASIVEVAGKGIVMLASGVDVGATAIDSVGRSVQTMSSSVPSLVTAVVMGGGFLTMFFPGIQDAIISTTARLGLMFAGRLAAGARSYVNDNSMMSTILQTLEVFTHKAQQDFN